MLTHLGKKSFYIYIYIYKAVLKSVHIKNQKHTCQTWKLWKANGSWAERLAVGHVAKDLPEVNQLQLTRGQKRWVASFSPLLLWLQQFVIMPETAALWETVMKPPCLVSSYPLSCCDYLSGVIISPGVFVLLSLCDFACSFVPLLFIVLCIDYQLRVR